MPVRLSLPAALPIGEFLRQVDIGVSAGIAHQGCPIEEVLRALPGGPAPGELFSAAVNVFPLDDRFRFGDHDAVGHPLSSGPTDEPAVMVYGSERARRMTLCVDLNATRNTERDLRRWERQVLDVLAALVTADPLDPVADVRLTAPDAQPSTDHAGQTVDADRHTILDLVVAQAIATPDAIAVEAAGERCSYREMVGRADRLAAALVRRGVRPETPVAIGMSRSIHLPVALLATLRAGACYVPLEPTHPERRLRSIMTETGCSLVLVTADGEFRDLGEDVERLAVDEFSPVGDRSLLPAVDPDGLAYLIYTSGSSGTPKGVAVPHRGLLNRTMWTVNHQAMSPADRVLQKTPLSFDAAGWEFFAPLISGGTLVLAADGAERDPALLLREVARHRITVLQVVPSVLRALVDQPGWTGCETLRLVSCGGEPLRASLARRLADRVKAELWNTYGPTECSIDVTAGLADPAQVSGPVPIGGPIDNSVVRVLDCDGVPVPVGVAGELYAGGAGVARGYLGRPDLTAERFVPDPFGHGGRLYRTGDLARWREDGTLDYLGRMDDQVKVNGVRIEPAEVEAALAEHPDVTGTAVIAATDGRGSHLVAYHSGAMDPRPAELRAFLAKRIPEALIPTRFVPLRELPRTVSGKIDRHALTAMASDDTRGRPQIVAPRTESEMMVARAWGTVLAADGFGVHDDFFERGGSSLSLTALARELSVLAGVPVPFRTLFTRSTVAAQAALLTELGGDARTDSRNTGAEESGPTPLSSGQRRLWFLDQVSPESAEWVVPVFVRIPGSVDPSRVRATLRALARRHAMLRVRYEEHDGDPRQLIEPEPNVELEVIHCSAAELPDHCARQLERGFDVANGPVWRSMLAVTDVGTPLLLVTVHHSAFDGRSAVVLERDFRELYRVGGDIEASNLPALPMSYTDYVRRQSVELTEEFVEQELAFWREELSAVAGQDLPADHTRPPVRDPRAAVETFTVPPEVADAVIMIGHRCGATPFTTFLTALATLLARISDRWDVVVGTAVDGRDLPEVDDVVGFFVNSVALRCRLAPEWGFAAAVASVGRGCRSALAHGRTPFERLVDDLGVDRDPARTPLFQVAFNLYEDGTTNEALSHQDVELLVRGRRATKTDLSLFLRRTADGGVQGAWEYATSLFDPDTVASLGPRLVHLLTAVAADPDLRLDAIPLVDQDERDQLLTRAEGPAVEPSPDTVLDMIRAQVARTPDAPALFSSGGTMSFRELDQLVDGIAARLRVAGIGVGDVVAVLLPRTPDLIGTLLAAWRVGAAYLPLDMATPPERVDRLVRASGARAVVTASEGEVVVTGTEDGAGYDRPSHAQIDPDSLAYLIFTSGSTGEPKGVRITHRSLACHIRWAAGAFGANGPGGAPLFSSVAFDLVVPTMFVPLVTGRPVRLVPQDVPLDELGAELARGGPYSFVKLTPAHLDLLRQQLNPSQLDNLAHIYVVAGDRFFGADANWWLDLLGAGRLRNEYGPTEATVGTSIHQVDVAQTADVVPIGRPLPGVTAHVLDGDLRLVAPRAIGELYVGGAGLAQGYSDPAQTAARFVPNPYGPPGSRLYRTGDLASVTTDGTLRFHGRTDDQLKINGYRVEPAEARSALLTHADVRDAAVLAQRLESGGLRMIGYVVPYGEPPGIADLEAHCRMRLPDYLVPGRLVVVPRLPLNANGKLDRARLAALEPIIPTYDDGAADEPDPVRERITEIWRGLLNVPADVPIDARESFFALGGHSLLLVRMIVQVKEAFEIPLPFSVAIEGPTLAELADFVTAQIEAEVANMSEAEAAEALRGQNNGQEG
ncbi:amino acid adenylation domain-containing protein [Amycolatopsis sp. NPDC000673]|uniref:amino acid adenylation domain-containing protein n=1 Tax=Amycolatopsis sp. NPDC000673 TaxID=3154267 RepID=UPI003324CB4C